MLGGLGPGFVIQGLSPDLAEPDIGLDLGLVGLYSGLVNVTSIFAAHLNN